VQTEQYTEKTHPSAEACGPDGWIRRERMARRKLTGGRWSMRLLAQLTGMNPDTINCYEKSRTKPHEVYLGALRRVFEVHPRAVIRD